MWKTIGHSNILDLFQRAIKSGSLSHAYLLVGPPQVGKMTLALDVAMALNCMAGQESRPCGECPSCRKISAGKYADVQIVGLNSDATPETAKEKTEISIEQIKEMLHSASLPPFEGSYRVYIIDEAANLSIDAANRLLKTLEEPPRKVIFLLLTSQVRLIPATIISRCQKLNLARLKTAEMETALINLYQVEPEKARLLSRLSRGCLGWAVDGVNNPGLFQNRSEKFEKMQTLMANDYSDRLSQATQLALQFGKKRETVYETLDSWASWWRDILLVKIGRNSDIISIDYLPALSEMAGSYNLVQIKETILNLIHAVEQLKLNANARLVLEALMLNIPKPVKGKTGRPQVEVKNA